MVAGHWVHFHAEVGVAESNHVATVRERVTSQETEASRARVLQSNTGDRETEVRGSQVQHTDCNTSDGDGVSNCWADNLEGHERVTEESSQSGTSHWTTPGGSKVQTTHTETTHGLLSKSREFDTSNQTDTDGSECLEGSHLVHDVVVGTAKREFLGTGGAATGDAAATGSTTATGRAATSRALAATGRAAALWRLAAARGATTGGGLATLGRLATTGRTTAGGGLAAASRLATSRLTTLGGSTTLGRLATTGRLSALWSGAALGRLATCGSLATCSRFSASGSFSTCHVIHLFSFGSAPS